MSTASTGGNTTGGNTVDPSIMHKLGIADGSKPEEVKAALAKFCQAHAVKMADAPAEELEAAAKELLEVAEGIEKDHPESATAMRKMSAKMGHMAKFAQTEPRGTTKGEEQNAAIHIKSGQSHNGKRDTPIRESVMAMSEDDEEKAAKAEMSKQFSISGPLTFRALATHLAAKMVPAQEMAALKGELQTMSAELAANKAEKLATLATSYVEQQITDGRADPKATAALIQTFSRAAGDAPRATAAEAGAAAIEPFLLTKGALTLGKRLTVAGHPIGKPVTMTSFEADSPDKIEQTIVAKAKELQAKEPTKYATFSAASRAVLKADPELAAQYRALGR
jgi:hypothetical protein